MATTFGSESTENASTAGSISDGVVTAPRAEAPGIISLKRVKGFLGLSLEEHDHDDLIMGFFPAALATARTIVGQAIISEVYEHHMFEGKGSTETLVYFPVTNLQVIEQYTGPGTWSPLPEGTYELLPRTPQMYQLVGSFPRCGLFRATFTVGYQSNALPADIVEILEEMVALKYKESEPGAKRFAVRSRSTNQTGVGKITTETFDDMRSKWKSRLASHTVGPPC